MSLDPAIVFEWDGDEPLTDETPRPIPAAETLPEWFQQLPTDYNGSGTVKLCSSFGDALRLGYIIPLPYDLEYTYTDETLTASLSSSSESVKIYGQTTPELSENSSFRPPEAKVSNPWKIQTPNGYSTLITYPMNRVDSGVKPYSLLVETDSYDGRINIPVSLTRSEATIPSGTPFLHVVPIRRDDIASDYETTSSSESPELWGAWERTQQQALSVKGFYRRFCWEPKTPCTVTDTTATENDAPADCDPSELTGTVGPVDEPLHLPQISTKDENYGVVPGPRPANEVLPKWIEDPETLPGVDQDDKRVCRWARAVMSIGWNMQSGSNWKFTVQENGELSMEHEYDAPLDRGLTGHTKMLSTHPLLQFGEAFPLDEFHLVKGSSVWFTCTPPGYSLLVREPFNHRQQIVRGYAGLVDSDRYIVDGNIIGKLDVPPGEYEIPAATPIVTELPIHRESLITQAYVVE